MQGEEFVTKINKNDDRKSLGAIISEVRINLEAIQKKSQAILSRGMCALVKIWT